MGSHAIRSHLLSSLVLLLGVAVPGASWADGLLLPPVLPGGRSPTLWESRQEAIIIQDIQELEALQSRAVEDLVLKLSVQSLEEVETFIWVIPFPNPPEIAPESPQVFKEIHRYVSEHARADGKLRPQAQTTERREGEVREADTLEGATRESGTPERETPTGQHRQESGEEQVSAAPRAEEATAGAPRTAPRDASGVEVISQKIVGTFDVAVVRALEKGALDAWLENEGFRSTRTAGKDVVEFYRKKGYVFACVTVVDVKLAKGRTVDLPPLRFTFETGGRDGVYFPMKMTSLQTEPFDLELHIFSPAPIDENASEYGYAHRGLRREYRDGNEDGDAPREGGFWSALEEDRLWMRDDSHLPSLAELFRRVRPSGKHRLTSIRTRGVRPQALEGWPDDLWVFPRYPDADFVPFDVRPGGPAAEGWAKADPTKGEENSRSEDNARKRGPSEAWPLGVPVRHVDIEAKEHDSGP
jgi:hypothetical protein